jgi:hypothetical protein
MNPIQIRALINDEVAQMHNRRACTVGFWLSMLAGLLTFAWLEYRAHADA